MKPIQAKLKNCRGETLVEVLASILIATLSVTLLLSGVTISNQLNRQADTTDASFYETLTAAETRQTPVALGHIQITEGGTSVEIPIQVYGSEGLYAYALHTAAEGDDP